MCSKPTATIDIEVLVHDRKTNILLDSGFIAIIYSLATVGLFREVLKDAQQN